MQEVTDNPRGFAQGCRDTARRDRLQCRHSNLPLAGRAGTAAAGRLRHTAGKVAWAGEPVSIWTIVTVARLPSPVAPS